MTDGAVLTLFVRMLVVVAEVLAPLLGMMLTVGLTTSILQAAMQLQDPTVTYLPRLLAVAAAVVIFGGWMLATMVHFASGILDMLGTVAVR
ncbi:MAG TPA: flagellar biosynthetic protein FliQ [bacterium]|nr:flagellar biosynthetic protein FliQ [bacterium]